MPYIPQPIEQIRSYFAGMEMVEPGVVSITEWRPDPTDIGSAVSLPETTGAVARKP